MYKPTLKLSLFQRYNTPCRVTHNHPSCHFLKFYQYSSGTIKEPDWQTIAKKIATKCAEKANELKNNTQTEGYPEDVQIMFHNFWQNVAKIGHSAKAVTQDSNSVLRDSWIIQNFTDATHSLPYILESAEILKQNVSDKDKEEIVIICKRISYTIDKFNREIIGINEQVCGIKMSELDFQ